MTSRSYPPYSKDFYKEIEEEVRVYMLEKN